MAGRRCAVTDEQLSNTRRATLRDVARVAGVHPATASRALNQATRQLVNAETVRRIEEAARALEYRPDHLARSLKTRRSAAIGVVLPDLTNPLFPPIVRGIEDRLVTSGYVPLIGNTDNDDDRERLVLARLEARQVDGLIVATATRRHPPLVELARSGLPIVLINRVIDGHRLPSVSVDDSSGIRAAVEHLAGLGHHRIAHVAGPQDVSTGAGRYRGFRAGIDSAGLEDDPELIVFAETFSEAAGFEGACELLERRRPITAVVAANDMLALGCLRAFTRLGLRCPEDVSLVGFNDMPFVDRVSPPLTTVGFPHYDLGTYAAELVLERIDDADGPVKVLFLPPELVVRSSTGPAPPDLGASGSSRKRRPAAQAPDSTAPA
ncbi:MAG: LacI family DNA-binding transcriptional regulator [Acidimicrobiales bacterium]